MTFWRFYYHIIWATKHRAPLITPENEPIIFTAIRAKAAALESTLLAINGAADHLHVAVSIPPGLAVAEWVANAKGVSSYEVNSRFPNTQPRFRWQQGYSALTFGVKNLDFVLAYIACQKEHHASGSSDNLKRSLEYLDDDDAQPL